MKALAVMLSIALLPHPSWAETLIATRTIRALSVIGPDDVTQAQGVVPGALRDANDAVGLEARVALYAGRPIHPGDLAPAAVVERNQIVALVFRQGGLSITAQGRALGRGAPGETIRVMNRSSRTTVFGIVRESGVIHATAVSSPPPR